jgi:hypothetical protein
MSRCGVWLRNGHLGVLTLARYTKQERHVSCYILYDVQLSRSLAATHSRLQEDLLIGFVLKSSIGSYRYSHSECRDKIGRASLAI